MLLLIDLGSDQVASLLAPPEFEDLAPSAMNQRVERLKANISQNFSSQSASYSLLRDGAVKRAQ